MATRQEVGNVDSALEELGCYGKYTLLQFSLQAFAQVALIHHMLSIVFTGQKNNFQCPAVHPHNRFDLGYNGGKHTIHNNSFNETLISFSNNCYGGPGSDTLNVSDCNAYNVEYELPKDRYFVSEFDLVCEREYLAGLTQTLLTLGQAVGSLVFPYFADNYGRKPVLLFCSFLWFGSGLALAFSVNYTMLAAFKTLVGIFLQGVSQTSLTVMAEVVTSRQRGFMFGCLVCVIGTVSAMLMVPVAFLLRNYSWRVLELAYCSYFVYIILYVFFMDESLRWLAANNFEERIKDLLKRASKWNQCNLENVVAAFYKGDDEMIHQQVLLDRSPDIPSSKYIIHLPSDKTDEDPGTKVGVLFDDILLNNTLLDCTTKNEEEKFIENRQIPNQTVHNERLNFFSLFKNQSLRFHTLFCTLAWFFNSLTFFALFLMSSTLSGSLYLNFFLNCVVELPAAIFVYLFIDRLGRKVCFAAFSIVAGTCLVGLAVTAAVSEQQDTVIKTLAIFGKFGITGSFSVLFTVTPELFPTNVRNTAQGITSLSASLGGMLAPFAELLMTKVVYAPGLIFGISSLVLGACSYFLPETANRQLPQSLSDVESWTRSRSPSKKKQSSCLRFQAVNQRRDA